MNSSRLQTGVLLIDDDDVIAVCLRQNPSTRIAAPMTSAARFSSLRKPQSFLFAANSSSECH